MNLELKEKLASRARTLLDEEQKRNETACSLIYLSKVICMELSEKYPAINFRLFSEGHNSDIIASIDFAIDSVKLQNNRLIIDSTSKFTLIPYHKGDYDEIMAEINQIMTTIRHDKKI